MSQAIKSIKELEQNKKTEFLEFVAFLKTSLSKFSSMTENLDEIEIRAATLTGGWIAPKEYKPKARIVFHQTIIRLRALAPLLNIKEREPATQFIDVTISSLKAAAKNEKSLKELATKLAAAKDEKQSEQDQAAENTAQARWDQIKALFVDVIKTCVSLGIENCLQFDRVKLWEIERDRAQNLGLGITEIVARGLTGGKDTKHPYAPTE